MNVKKIEWEDLELEGHNDGYIYGLEEDLEDKNFPNYVEWFKTKRLREEAIKINNLNVIK